MPTPRHSFALLLTAALTAACGGKDNTQAANAPAREIQLAPPPAAQPQLNDTPAKTSPAPKKIAQARREEPKPAPLHVQVSPVPPKPAEAAPAPAPAAPPAAPMGTVSAGSVLAVHPAVRVCTSTHKVGDRFSATLNESITGSNGATVPAGSNVVLRVVESARSENSKDSIKLAFDAVSLKVGEDTYLVDARVSAPPVEKVRAQSTTDQVKKVGAGAAIGAILGQVLGKNTKSTVIGGAVGAAAGGAVAAGTADYDGCIPVNAPMTLTLNRPLTVKAGAKAPF